MPDHMLVPLPSESTVARLKKRLSINERTLREGDAIRQERSQEAILADTYTKLSRLYEKFLIHDRDKYDARPILLLSDS